MMFERKKGFSRLAVLLVLVAFPLSGAEHQGCKLLRQAYEFSLTAPYSSSFPLKSEGAGYSCTIYRLPGADGNAYERRDILVRGRVTQSTIMRPDGSVFMVEYGNTPDETLIVNNKSDLPYYNDSKTWSYPFKLIAKDIESGTASYQVSSSNYQNIPCYKVTVDFQLPDDESLAARTGLPLEEIRNHRESFLSRWPAKRVYWIGKKQPFLYQCSYYSYTRVPIFSCEWGNADFAAKIPPALFDLPQGKIHVAATRKDFARLENRNQDSIIAAWLNRTWELILGYGVYITLSIAIFCMLFIFVIKMKQRRLYR